MVIPEKSRDITADWLNEVLHQNGFLKDASIVSLKHEPMGIGEGFLSDMARLTVTYDRDIPGIPATMIAKLPTSYESARAIGMQLNLYEREIRFYIEILPKSPIRTPYLIYGVVDSENQRYVLLMEDCSHYTPADPELKGLDYEQTKIIAAKISDFHARWWDSDDLFSFPWLPKPDSPGRMASIDTFRSSWDICAQIEDFRKVLPEGGWEAGLKINEQMHWLVEDAPNDNLTIRHTDMRSDNMFFDWDTPDNPLIVFDWGMVSIGRGTGDLAFLLGFSLSTDMRRKIEKEMIDLYYQSLLNKGVSGYPFDEFWTDYRKALLRFTTIPVIAYAKLDHSDSRSTKLLNVALNRWFSSIIDNDATRVLP